jgi:xylulokinase
MTSPDYLLGIDIGGTGVKAGLFTTNGTPVGSGYGEYQMISRLPGQAEHDAEGWWQASVGAIRQAIHGCNPKTIRAVGIGCTNGLIAVDREARPLRPAIMLWDQRSLSEVDAIRRILGQDEVFSVTGNPVAPGAYSLPTILWLKHHEPDTFRRAHKLIVPGGYLVARLTGNFTIDFSRACTTLLFDIRRKEWHHPFLEALGIPREKLPTPMPSTQIAGKITSGAAHMTGLEPGTPVIAGCMDTVGASIGTGVIKPGKCFVIMGTAARVATPLDEARFDQRFMNCTHVFSESWLAIGAVNGVGSSLRWIRDNFGQMENQVAQLTGSDVYDSLTEQASLSPPGSKGLIFLPYISGERTPIWDPFARAAFLGVTLAHDRRDFFRSVLEGAAFAIRQAVDILENEQGSQFQALRIAGTAAKSTTWNQIISDVLGRPIISVSTSNAEVLGAAILAGNSIDVYSDIEDVLHHYIAIDQRFEPNPVAHAAYNQLFSIYKELYPSLKPHFEQQAQLDLPGGWVAKNYATPDSQIDVEGR